ncbi:MAG: EamA/RhaT family transporter [Bacteroidales bacterium]|nr:EamA/RhaT family transporter [Bacteroidales bacterium]
MIFLLLSILSSTTIAVIFKLMAGKSIELLPVIVINYFAALIAGLLLFDGELSVQYILQSNWIYISIFIGSLLIIGFYLIGYTTQKAGIAITTIANKMSVIIPVLFSIFYFSEATNWQKLLGMTLALVAVGMAVHKKEKGSSQFSFLPILMFLVIGTIDSSVKLAQHNYVPESDVSLFSALSFGLAGIIGLVILGFSSKYWSSFKKPMVWTYGILIGLANFGSLYFLIHALNKSGLDSSIVYGVNSVGIIILSVSLAILFFSEKLSRINIIGICLALVAVMILMLWV